MEYDKTPIERLPVPVRKFAQLHDEVSVNEMPDESIRWGIHSPSGETEFHIHEFSDEDGVDITLQVRQNGIEVFGYIDPETFMLQDVQKAPIRTGTATVKSLRFTFYRGGSMDVALGFSESGDPVIQLLG